MARFTASFAALVPAPSIKANCDPRRRRATVIFVLVPLLLVLAAGCESEVSDVCGQGVTTGNNDVPASFPVEMGQRGGAFEFRYETRNAKDRIQVFYEGQALFDSGCVGESRTVALRYGPGQGTSIDVVMQPNCGDTPMTSWLFAVGCPDATIRDGAAATAGVKVTQTGEDASSDASQPSGPFHRH